LATLRDVSTTEKPKKEKILFSHGIHGRTRKKAKDKDNLATKPTKEHEKLIKDTKVLFFNFVFFRGFSG